MSHKPNDLQFVYSDSGNCRIYYTNRRSKKLYCFQESIDDSIFDLFHCSKDGEPCHEVGINEFDSVQLPCNVNKLTEKLYKFLEGHNYGKI